MNKTERYFRRTVEHIQRVQNNALLLATKYARHLMLSQDDCRELLYNVLNHDRSKFSTAQFAGYIELTEYYYRRRNGEPEYEYPDSNVKALTDAAWQNHYRVENHHPERFAGSLGKYSQLDALETACDLQAMAQEFNEGNCRKYFEEVWKPKQSKNFYDDFNWACVCEWMDAAIKCFEHELELEQKQK